MRTVHLLAVTIGLLFSLPSQHVCAQRLQAREKEFLTTKPRISEPLPDVVIHSLDGSPFRTGDLKGHYTVLTFGCLTCPPSMWNIAGLEAVNQDYHPKGVRFYFVFKALAHPELAGNYVQPFTTAERLAQAQKAKQQFGTSIPWIVDAIDNRFKHAMGDRPNSQFIIDPDGVIVRKRAWSQPDEVRRDLEELVGPVEHITTEEDMRLKLDLPQKSPAARGVVTRIPRPGMLPLKLVPVIHPNQPPFYAKLRAEADASLLDEGAGRLYLGFHLDPLYDAHWNNLTPPLSYTIETADGVVIDHPQASAPNVSATTDCDPREFLLNVESWPADTPLKIQVTCFACEGEEACHALKQEYTVYRERDTDGGGARGAGAGYWDAEEFAQRLLAGDRNKDGRLVKDELVGLVRSHFKKLDTNSDGYLDHDELLVIASWLNHYHQPAPGLSNIQP
jgi:hypothetical protein